MQKNCRFCCYFCHYFLYVFSRHLQKYACKKSTINSDLLSQISSFYSKKKTDEGSVFSKDEYGVIVWKRNMNNGYDEEVSNLLENQNIIEKAFNKEGEYVSDDNVSRRYFMTPFYADRELEGDMRCFCGYKGDIIIETSDNSYLTLNVSVYRPIDEYFGWIFAAPVYKRVDFQSIFTAENLVESIT